MRRYTSVLMLGARGVVMPLIAVLLLMSAAEAGLVFWELSGGWILERFWSDSYVVWAYRVALVLLAAACCVHVSGLGGSRVYYTMHRLRISEWTATVLLGLCYGAAFVVLWAAQAGILTAVTAYCAARADAGGQAVFLVSWNDDFFHAMLPLGQWTGYVRQLLMALGMGMSCAVWSFWAAPQQLRLCRADHGHRGGGVHRPGLPGLRGRHKPGRRGVHRGGVFFVFCKRGGEPV